MSSEKQEDGAPLSEIQVPSQQSNDEDTPVLVEVLDEDDGDSLAIKERQKRQQESSKRYFVYAIGLWTVQLVLVISLKRLGFLQKGPLEELNDKIEELHQYFNVSIDSFTNSMSAEKKNVGLELSELGAKAHYPIVMVPGFVTSGLEVWAGRECAMGFFRQRIWAAITGAKSFLVERDCWSEHMTLDPYTGSDPPKIRVRASEGIGATDYFMANYWVWGKLIEALASVGYDPSNMRMHPFDWRLPFHLLEERDGFFTNLKSSIEAMHKTTGKKVVLATHSMGAQVIHHFFGWVTTSEKAGGGGGGRKWVDKHLHTYINIAGSHLGVPKAATALLSGEIGDIVFAGRMASMVESFFGRRQRRNLWSSWGSLWIMLPKGGNGLWGPAFDMCLQREVNDTLCPDSGSNPLSPLIAMTDAIVGEYSVHYTTTNSTQTTQDLNSTLRKFVSKQSHETEELIDFLQQYGAGLGPDTVGSKYHSQYGKDKVKSRVWYDVTRSPLPYAPAMKIFCLYGTGLPTERAYYYKRNWVEMSSGGKSRMLNNITEPVVMIDTEKNDESRNISSGIKYGDGDGSVPLISLGYICADAWQRKDSGLNPAKSRVYTREYKHETEFSRSDPMRSGPRSSDHVDILGNVGMMEDFLRIVTDFESEEITEDRIASNIRELAQKINAHPQGGVFKKKKK